MLQQERMFVHLYRRRGAVWMYSSHGSPEDVIELTEPACSLGLADLYAGLE